MARIAVRSSHKFGYGIRFIQGSPSFTASLHSKSAVSSFFCEVGPSCFLRANGIPPSEGIATIRGIKVAVSTKLLSNLLGVHTPCEIRIQNRQQEWDVELKALVRGGQVFYQSFAFSLFRAMSINPTQYQGAKAANQWFVRANRFRICAIRALKLRMYFAHYYKRMHLSARVAFDVFCSETPGG